MPSSLAHFQTRVWNYYRRHKRRFPWRETRDPYRILVSEIMLQQTQAPRVVAKYESFLKRFPTVQKLAAASVASVLREWQGLGYNRRGLALKKSAEAIVTQFKGKVPHNYEALLSLPGVGPATAGDILAFAWNEPVTVIETNIRSVFINEFFPEADSVHDRELLPLISRAVDTKNPREWYYALMDYGAWLKKTVPNPSRRSRHFTAQSPFKGSNREQRSKILRYLLSYPKQTAVTIAAALDSDLPKLIDNLERLSAEGLIASRKSKGKQIYLIP